MFDVESRRIPGNRAFRGNRRKNRTDVRFDARVVGIFGISGERQQSYGRQYRENRDYDDEFDEGEASVGSCFQQDSQTFREHARFFGSGMFLKYHAFIPFQRLFDEVYQRISESDHEVSAPFALENGLEPKNPECAENGLGWGDLMTTCL